MSDWKNKLIQEQIIWEYPGHGPHAVFTLSGKHASSYFNSDYLTNKPGLLKQVARDLHKSIDSKIKSRPDYVVSYAPYGIGIGSQLAELFNCRFAYAEPNRKGLQLKPGDKVLLCADDLHSGKSMIGLLNRVIAGRADIIAPPAFIANCSSKDNFNAGEIIALIDLPIESWIAEKCPLCAAGSKALEARQHWQDLFQFN